MNRNSWIAGSSSVLLLAALVGGCRNRAEVATRGSDTAAGGESAAIGTDTAAAPASNELSDANIAALVDEANKADSSAGAIAVKKASSADVKRFARMMMGEHHALRVEGQQVVKKANITPEPPANDPVAPMAQQETQVLQSTAAGPAFDKAYIDQEVTAHRAVKDLLNQAEGAAKNADLKAAIQKATPVVERHLKEAERLQQQLAGKA
jgi:putative membrane protein